MPSAQPGQNTSQAEVVGITPLGVWLLFDDQELFLDFEHFPWFKDAPVSSVFNVDRPMPHHFYWPDLDIDLDRDSIVNPSSYPLVSGKNPVVAEEGD